MISQALVKMICDVKQIVDDTTGVCSIIMFTLHKGNIDLIDHSVFVLFRLSLPLAIKNKKQFIHGKF